MALLERLEEREGDPDRLEEREGERVAEVEKDSTKTHVGKVPDQLPSPLQALTVLDPV